MMGLTKFPCFLLGNFHSWWCLLKLRFLTGDVKTTFTQAALDISIYILLTTSSKYLWKWQRMHFWHYAFCKQKRYLYRYLNTPNSMKLCTFINRLQKLNTYLRKFPPVTWGQETTPSPQRKPWTSFIIPCFVEKYDDWTRVQ